MKYEVITSENFARELKRLAKKYDSLKADVKQLGEKLTIQPDLGTPIGRDCYKIRLAIKSKGKGKRGGARVITFVVSRKEKVVLLSIYDKSEAEDIPDATLTKILMENQLE